MSDTKKALTLVDINQLNDSLKETITAERNARVQEAQARAGAQGVVVNTSGK